MSYVAPDKEELKRRGRDEHGNPLKVTPPAKPEVKKVKAKSKGKG